MFSEVSHLVNRLVQRHLASLSHQGNRSGDNTLSCAEEEMLATAGDVSSLSHVRLIPTAKAAKRFLRIAGYLISLLGKRPSTLRRSKPCKISDGIAFASSSRTAPSALSSQPVLQRERRFLAGPAHPPVALAHDAQHRMLSLAARCGAALKRRPAAVRGNIGDLAGQRNHTNSGALTGRAPGLTVLS